MCGGNTGEVAKACALGWRVGRRVSNAGACVCDIPQVVVDNAEPPGRRGTLTSELADVSMSQEKRNMSQSMKTSAMLPYTFSREATYECMHG